MNTKFWEWIGSLSNSEGDVYENVGLKVKSRCLKLYLAFSISFNSSSDGSFFLELNSKRLCQSSGEENESRCLVCTSSTKRETRQSRVVVVQGRQRNLQKSVMHVQSCCFASLNLLLFSPEVKTEIQSKPLYGRWGGHRKCPYWQGIRIKRVEFRDKVRAFFPQGQSKLSVIIRCLY